jgi:two-component system, cell cycle sensor histidine kinase and response regulator CckA
VSGPPRPAPHTARSMTREPVSPAAILVVDDHEVVARLVRRFLGHLGYTVLAAASGEQALAIVRQRQPPIDLVLSDAELRDGGHVGGAALATAVLAECPGPQLVLVTERLAGSAEPIEVLGRHVPILPKPLDLDELQELLRAMLPALLPVASSLGSSPLGLGVRLPGASQRPGWPAPDRPSLST